MINFIKDLERRVLLGENISFQEALSLTKLDSNEDIGQLCISADNIRKTLCGDKVIFVLL